MSHEQRAPQEPLVRLGVSTCLLGESVRFDGGHKRDPFLTNILGRYVEWVPVCPEVEMGMSIPRESIRLEGAPETPRLVAIRSRTDYTETMKAWSQGRLEQLAALNLHGYVLKKDSPSCGLFRVRVYDHHNMPQRKGRGIYAEALVKRLPLLPVEEEGRLNDQRLRENFIERVFAYYRWTRLLEEEATPGGLVRFHTAHKLTLMAHSPAHYQQMGQLVAQAGKLDWDELTAAYGRMLMEGLGVMGTRGKHVNVLQHLMGFLKDHLGKEDKAELVGLIEDYRRALVPLIVPLTLLKHHLNRHSVPGWVHQQVYLKPYPKELMLRNHV
jgi:uncharacterized protein YbgA (DUF1722 family)/uncharacterized protein YbbK (DUF523 family)